jgi:hypothetical protein
MAIHILGNGPSLGLFDRTKSCYDSDIIVGCNFSDVSLRPHYTVLIDVRAIKQFMSEDPYVLEIDAVLSTRAYNYLESHFGWDKVPDSAINVIDTIDLIRDRKISKNLAMNSGQHAAVYSLRNNKDQKEIHIWGTDSFWTRDIQSSTDPIARPKHSGPRVRPHITTRWNRYWSKIFQDFPRTEFVIHAYSDSKVDHKIQSHTNVRIDRHDNS